MFCTNCNTKFNWSNLKIITRGSFHNPHYSEYISRRGRGRMREAGDIICGGVPYPNYNQNHSKIMSSISDAIAHVRTYTMATIPSENTAGLTEARIKYIIGDYTEKRWMSEVMKIRKKCSFNRNLYQILDMFSNCSVYILRNIIDDQGVINDEVYPEQKNELDNLFKYADEEVNKLLRIYKYSREIFGHHFDEWRQTM
jgi:hypothetical protein